MLFRYAVCASEGAALKEPVLYRGSYPDAFEYVRSIGGQGVEVHVRNAATADRDALHRASEKTGVAVSGVATGLAKRVDGLSLVDDDPVRRAEAVSRVKGHIDLAEEFGCTVVIGSMRDNIPSPERREETLTRLYEGMVECAEYISGKNCSIVFEAINRYENNYFNTAEETAAFVDRIGSPQIRVLLDTFHMNIEERDMSAAIRLLGDRLGHFHLADNNRWYPGQGTIDFRASLLALHEIGYKGYLSCEYLPLPDEKTAAAKGLAYMLALDSALETALAGAPA